MSTEIKIISVSASVYQEAGKSTVYKEIKAVMNNGQTVTIRVETMSNSIEAATNLILKKLST